METNSKGRQSAATYNKSKLDKFARRLIRAVSRMLLVEKRDEEEVWEGLKKETGCDCKELWYRMRALTLRKLNRLLEVDDQVERLPKAARMTLIDWLLFDTVLVHQNYDVIGMTDTSTTDRQILIDLYDLVEKYQLEFFAGDQLAEAWSQATIEYNKNNRQCTPMLLQRRWYQLKLATRARFYNFWYEYKGVLKKMGQASLYRPTPLQTRIAKGYKTLVVTAFPSWEDLVKNKLVMLREDFAVKELEKEDVIKENSPDVICLEPNIETIDLDNESDGELEYRKPQINEPLAIKIKEEPKDEDEMDETVPYQNLQDKLSYVAEAVMEATTLELEELELSENIDLSITDKENKDDVLTTEANSIIINDDKNDVSDDVIEVTTVQESQTVLSKSSEEDKNVVLSNEINEDNESAAPKIDDDINIIPDTAELEQVLPQENDIDTINVKIEDDIEIVTDTKEPEQVLPQITNIFGGVNDSTEALSKISVLAAQLSKAVNSNMVIPPDTNNSPVNVSSNSVEEISGEVTDSGIIDISADNSKVAVKSEASKNIWFGELSNDIDFVDDGIQLVDDGIALEDDNSFQCDDIKTEIDVDSTEFKMVEKQAEDNEENQFDKKLLMVPVVYTVKIDEMGVLPSHLLNHINNKSLIDIISTKSKIVTNHVDIDTESVEKVESIEKINLSSHLLQKPRNRQYNPIQLCKNPDFNTRLKRLNVGFFSSSRNRLLLKSCQPVTIDVSKAFEDKLINGSIYLNLSGDDKVYDDKNKVPKITETSSVLPSALPAQSLIDNTKGEIAPLIHDTINSKPVEVIPQSCQRSKVINLPDISEIRRINQNLLTAQVTPIQFKNDCSNTAKAKVAVKDTDGSLHTFNSTPGPASRKRPIRDENKTSNSTSNTTSDVQTSSMPRNNQLLKRGNKIVLWKSREIRPEVNWLNSTGKHYTSDTLLALDSLYKMLYLLSEGEQKTSAFDKYSKKKKKSKLLQAFSEDKKTTQNDDNDDVQVISETCPEKTESKKVSKGKNVAPKKQKYEYCCWASEKISEMQNSKKRKAKHKCPFPLCLCCCKFDLLDYFKKRRETSISQPPACVNPSSVITDNVVKQNDLNVENIDTDVAELIPIQNTNQLSMTNTVDLVNSRQENNSDTDDVLCNDKATSTEAIVLSDNLAIRNTSSDEISPSNEVGIDDSSLALGAEVSIRSSKARVVPSNILNSATINNATNIHSSIKNPRFRVNHAPIYAPHKKSETRSDEGGVENNIDGSSISLGEDSMPTSEICSTEVSAELTYPATVTSQCTETNPTSTKNLYLCIEPLVTKSDENLINKNTIVSSVSRRGGRFHRKHTDNPENTNKSLIKIRNDLTTKASPKTINTIQITPQVPKSGGSQNMIYLNSKQISELPSNNPIHLGKKKILLTTFKFPPNFKAFEAYQRNLRQTMALPKGITLKLLPSGRVTYTRNMKAVISEEFVAAMPHLIEAIQQQIDMDSNIETQVIPPLKPYSNNEIICLSDEESSQSEIQTAPINASDIVNSATVVDSSDVNTGINVLNNKENVTTVHSADINECVDNEDRKSDEKSNEKISTANCTDSHTKFSTNNKENVKTCNFDDNNERVDNEDIVSKFDAKSHENVEISDISCCSNSLETSKENNEVNLSSNVNIECNNSKNTSPLVNIVISSESLNETIVEKAVKDNGCIENDGNKTKNILSDLMAMSGIFPSEITQEPPLDIIPTETTQPPNEENAAKPVELDNSINAFSPVAIPHTSKDSNVSHSSQSSRFTQAFTPITSLAELKYSCAHNGSFFKLDLETRLLIPINVCMKNMIAHGSLKPIKSNKRQLTVSGPTIDLTDDDVPVPPKHSRRNSNLLVSTKDSDEYKKNSMKHRDYQFDDESDNVNDNSVNTENTSVENTTKPIKPLILFRARNLQDKLKRMRKDILVAKRQENSIRQRQKRKQEITNSSNPNCGQLTDHIGITESSESSSDEEPLANLAIKKRRIETDHPEETSDNIEVPMGDVNTCVPVTTEGAVADAIEDASANTIDETDEAGTGIGDPPEVLLEYLDEELLQEDEACILGV